jgi:hypothetical protein
MLRYALESKIESSETQVLAVYCSDHRFQGALREFLDQTLGLKANYDLLVVPGGPQGLAETPHLPKFAWASHRWLRFLIEAHSLQRVILIAHQDCGWYKWLAEYEAHGARGFPARERQERDLSRVREFLAADFPRLRVETYYAGWNVAGQVGIEAVLVTARDRPS